MRSSFFTWPAVRQLPSLSTLSIGARITEVGTMHVQLLPGNCLTLNPPPHAARTVLSLPPSTMTGAAERAQARPRAQETQGWFAIPAPLARLFKKFPLLTYPPNELPARSPAARDVSTLYVFISDEDALRGLPSFNPSCLKWQVSFKCPALD